MPLCKGGKCSPSAWGSEMFAVPEEGKREGGKRYLFHPHILPPRRFAAIRKRSMNHPPDTRAYCGILPPGTSSTHQNKHRNKTDQQPQRNLPTPLPVNIRSIETWERSPVALAFEFDSIDRSETQPQ